MVLIGILIFNVRAYGQSELKYLEKEAPTTYDPVTSTRDEKGVRLSTLLSKGLLEIDQNKKIQPILATGLPRYSADFRSCEITLKPNLSWPDGKPITAKDVKYSYTVYKNPISDYSDRNIFDNFSGVETEGELTVRFRFTQPVDPQDYNSRLTFALIPQHANINDYIRREDSFAQQPIGCGSWQLSKIEENIVGLSRNEHFYKKGSPFIDKITMMAQLDLTKWRFILVGNYCNFLVDVPYPNDLPDLDGNPRIRLQEYPSLKWHGIAYNCKSEFLKFREVRQALSYAFNREDVLKSDYNNRGELISGPYAPTSWAYNTDIKPKEFDPAKAESLLKGVGFVDTDGDGIREKNGLPLHLRCYISKLYSDVERDLFNDWAKQVRSVGVDAEVVQLDPASWADKVSREKDYDVTYIAWTLDEAANIYTLFHANEIRPDGNNIVQFDDPRVNQLLNDFRNTTDRLIKSNISHRLHAILDEECPYTFLWTLRKTAAYNSRLRDVAIEPFSLFLWAENWIYEEE